ncbi:nitrate- and nitrite sensing domain-containing protein [Amycolatopsis rhabdoformis]|uniref:histidine kinase n=1 Tax=Amycolatopsis rhabdoformis TaxID=1448059 RepID=A0ABZ1HYR7_9PSEU|nr:nitrate- and nitrite sensing domain-containing protein [Amycolatopsis rhabdoformis]WSE26651.1 nitrate- and nitrite sensing domain-containing protein [Amycolatopsis rhabdoformis]
MKRNSVRRSRGSSIRSRVLAIALIPSLALLLVGVALAGYLITDALKARDYAQKIRTSEGPGIPFILAAEQERQLSMSLLAGQADARQALLAARPKTDAAAAQISSVLEGNFADDKTVPASVKQNITTFVGLYSKVPQVRQQVDSSQLPLLQTFTFYNQIIDQFTQGVAGLAQAARGADNAFARLSAIPIFNAAEEMQRSDALSAAGLASDGLNGDEQRAYIGQIGAYHAQLEQSVPQMLPQVRASYDKLVAGADWRTVTQVENAFLSGEKQLPVPQQQWRDAAHQVATTLMTMFVTQSANATNAAIADADTTLTNSIIAGAAAVLLAIIVVLIALRLSRRFIARLARLREDTLDAAEVRLPELVERVRAGEPVDLEEGGHFLDHGDDEIGEVAEAFNKAQQAAIAAAVEEAKTREGTKTVFLNIAHRSQVIVHRQLKVLDAAERKQEDPDQLDTLFQLDHLSTRARRNAENLIILGGGQPGRQWRNPVSLTELVRGAAAETEDFSRVKTAALPSVAVRGPVVGDLVHLLAELIDNATSFSPPEARVELRGNVVGKGVVIEVEDQGLGLEKDQTDEINAMLADPPDFGIMALSDEPRLGLFVVARLASRHGISVHLRESAYGGTRAIVLVRRDLLAPLSEATPDVVEEAAPVPEQPVQDPARRNRVGRRAARLRPEGVPSPPALVEPVEPAPVEQPAARVEQPAAPRAARPPRPPQPAWPAHEPRQAPENGRPQQPYRPEAPGRPPLPQRRRQQNLVPQLREDRPTQEQGDVREDTPELARNRLSAFQQGTRRARDTEVDYDNRYGDHD